MDDKESQPALESNRVSLTQYYSPSWADRFTDWLERLPGPSWAYYLLLGLILLSLQAISPWLEGVYPIGTFQQVHLFLAAVISFFLAMFHYLDKWAARALEELHPHLTTSPKKYSELLFHLTTLPMGLTILASLIALALNFLGEAVTGPYYLDVFETAPISRYISRFVYILCWWVFGAFIFHTIHQLTQINRIYTRHTRIHLFRTKPFYAFSNLSAFTAGSLVMIIYGFVVVNPSIESNEPVVLVWVIFFILMAVVTFIWPQLGMHRLQEAEQERLVDEAYLRLERTIDHLHQQLDKNKYEDMEELNFAIASLEVELNLLKKIRTWPWEPETLQLLITALALPLGLWIIQLVFERLLGT